MKKRENKKRFKLILKLKEMNTNLFSRKFIETKRKSSCVFFDE
jgi:hypothetical protein